MPKPTRLRRLALTLAILVFVGATLLFFALNGVARFSFWSKYERAPSSFENISRYVERDSGTAWWLIKPEALADLSLLSFTDDSAPTWWIVQQFIVENQRSVLVPGALFEPIRLERKPAVFLSPTLEGVRIQGALFLLKDGNFGEELKDRGASFEDMIHANGQSILKMNFLIINPPTTTVL